MSRLAVLDVVVTKSASLALCGLCMELPPIPVALTSRFSKPLSRCLLVDVVQLEVNHRLVEGEGVTITGVDVVMVVGMYVVDVEYSVETGLASHAILTRGELPLLTRRCQR